MLHTDEHPTHKYIDGIPSANSVEDAWFNLFEAITKKDNSYFEEKRQRGEMVKIGQMLKYKLSHEYWTLEEIEEYSGLKPQTIIDILVGNIDGYYPVGGVVDLWLDMSEEEAKEQRIKENGGETELW